MPAAPPATLPPQPWATAPEAARLLACTVADVQRDRVGAAQAIAQRYAAVVVLKGAGTVVASGQATRIVAAGNPGMAVWGMGVMVGPILGPTLGGWLTESFNWRWVFFINLPVGIIAFLGCAANLPERAAVRRHFDLFGFAFIALGVGALQEPQLMLAQRDVGLQRVVARRHLGLLDDDVPARRDPPPAWAAWVPEQGPGPVPAASAGRRRLAEAGSVPMTHRTCTFAPSFSESTAAMSALFFSALMRSASAPVWWPTTSTSPSKPRGLASVSMISATLLRSPTDCRRRVQSRSMRSNSALAPASRSQSSSARPKPQKWSYVRSPSASTP